MLNFLKNLQSQREAEEERIKELVKTKTMLEGKISLLNHQVNSMAQLSADAQAQYDAKLESLRLVDSGFNALEEIGYERYIPTMESDNIEKEIFSAEFDIATLASKDELVLYSRTYRIDNSETKGKKFQSNYGKNLLCGFNTYCQAKEKAINETNYNHSVELIDNCFTKFNKQGALLGIMLNPQYLTLRRQILKCKLELKIRKARERAKLREERKRMQEQEKLLEEAHKEKEKLEAQRKAEDIAYAKALTDEERAQIKANIEALDKRIDDIDYRVNNPKAGWVYIIHSPSLPGMVKIGVSRRLNGPYERISELSSSSLPFPFILDGFCFSDDSFAVESAMYSYFDKQRVSVNREFFYITANEAINTLSNYFHQDVILNDTTIDALIN